jgi:hypothetical protein
LSVLKADLPVSREVNNVRNEHPDLIRSVPVEMDLF